MNTTHPVLNQVAPFVEVNEKQGGSEVRANTTRAKYAGDDAFGRRYAVTGHKWFLSAPMCDAFLILAQAPAGLGCFFLPLHHTAQLGAFGKPLIAQPLMRNVLADLALESEAATLLALRLAVAFDCTLAAQLHRASPRAVFGAWCDSRLAQASDVYGLLPARHDLQALIARTQPMETT